MTNRHCAGQILGPRSSCFGVVSQYVHDVLNSTKSEPATNPRKKPARVPHVFHILVAEAVDQFTLFDGRASDDREENRDSGYRQEAVGRDQRIRDHRHRRKPSRTDVEPSDRGRG